jgi:hypothetical protein
MSPEKAPFNCKDQLQLYPMNTKNKNLRPLSLRALDEELALLNDFSNEPGGEVNGAFVDISLMAKAFEKHAGRFLARRMTREFMAFHAGEEGVEASILVLKAEAPSKTILADLRVAVECARWVSPRFAVWYNRALIYSPGPELPTYSEVLQILAKEVKTKARIAAQQLAEIQWQESPDYVPGLSRFRQVRATIF